MTFLYNLFIDCLYVAIFCLFVPAYAMKRSFSAVCVDTKENVLDLKRSVSIYSKHNYFKPLIGLRGPSEIELTALILCQKKESQERIASFALAVLVNSQDNKELESQKQEQSVQVLTCLSLLADAQYRGDAGEVSDQVPKGQTILEFMKTLHS